MLEIKLSNEPGYDVLQFEHSLLSLSKWESRHLRPFLSEEGQPYEDLIDYYGDMLLGDTDPSIIFQLSPEQLDSIRKYIDHRPTASSVPPVTPTPGGGKEIVTSELVYYWLVSMQIPFSTETWNLNRLMTLIQITSYKSQPPEKQSQAEQYATFREMNARNKKRFNTKG